jgi:hypothetical protein
MINDLQTLCDIVGDIVQVVVLVVAVIVFGILGLRLAYLFVKEHWD